MDEIITQFDIYLKKLMGSGSWGVNVVGVGCDNP